MSGRSSLAARLFWTAVVGGGLGLWFGRPAFAAAGLALSLILLHRLDRPRRFRRLVRRLARAHARTLALRRDQECYVDVYGNLIDDGWLRERAYFAERTILPQVAARGFAAEAEARWDAVLDLVEEAAASVGPPEGGEAPDEGVAYERFCAARLERAGWAARSTPASGDQGADIVAERDGVRLVVQCKRHGRPVGNAAVQEVSAAARHWSGGMAAVVSSAGFTPAARKLAATTGVLLLHHDDLAALVPARGARRRGA